MDRSIDTRPSEKIESRENKYSGAILGCLMVISGAVFALAVLLVPKFVSSVNPDNPNPDSAILEWMFSNLSRIPFFGEPLVSVLQSIGIYDKFLQSPLISSFCLGGLVALISLRSLSRSIYKRFFAPFDAAVFSRIVSATAYDPLRPVVKLVNDEAIVMPWKTPTDGHRGYIWTQLLNFCASDKHFQYSLLLGRSGVGKSRFAIEFALEALAKRDAYIPSSSQEPRYEQLIRGLSNNRRRFASWWRVQVWRQTMGELDYWDTAWIRPENNMATSRPDRIAADKAMNKLDSWRPRRPTFILLDDPLINDSWKIVNVLEQNQSDYSHKVRLLIVNQTMPDDLLLRFNAAHKQWVHHRWPDTIQPLVIRSSDLFTDTDIRRLSSAMLRDKPGLVASDATVAKFQKVTKSNPLLVELGFNWLRKGHALELLSTDTLLEDRVERIVEAVRTAGFDESMLQFLTAVTVANGIQFEGAETKAIKSSNLSSLVPFLGTVPVSLANRASLFPGQVDNLNEELPPIRPDIIGHAFARYTLANMPNSLADAVIAGAWAYNPYGTLRTALRLEKSFGQLTSDPLASRLSALPPQHSELSNLELFYAYARAGCTISTIDLDSGDYLIGYGLTDTSISLLKRLDFGEVCHACDFSISLLDDESATGFRRFTEIYRLIISLMGVIAQSKEADSIDVLLSYIVQLLELTTHKSRGRVFDLDDSGKITNTVIKSLSDKSLERVYRKSVAIYQGVMQGDIAKSIGYAIGRLLCIAIDEYEDRHSVVAESWKEVVHQDLNASRKLMSHLPVAILKIEDGFYASPVSNLNHEQQAAWWVSIARGCYNDPHGCLTAAQELDAIDSIPQNDSIQQQRATAWRYVAYSRINDATACESAAVVLDEIAAPFPENELIQLLRAKAWCAVAFSRNSDATARESAAVVVDEIAAPFPENESIQEDRATAWRYVADSRN